MKWLSSGKALLATFTHLFCSNEYMSLDPDRSGLEAGLCGDTEDDRSTSQGSCRALDDSIVTLRLHEKW